MDQTRSLPASARVRTAFLALALLLAAPVVEASTSNAEKPVVTFANPGVYTVTLKACNWFTCATTSRSVTVLDPSPSITLATTEGLVGGTISVHAGELVHLFGNGIGKPPLAFDWQIVAPLSGQPAVTLPGSEGWWDTAGAPPGTYAAVLFLSNDYGAVDSAQAPLSAITILVLPDEALEFYTLTPCRIFDSRDGHGALLSGEAITIPADTCGVPANARALAANVTVVNPTGTGKLNLYPGNYPVPPTAESSFTAGVTRANDIVVGLSTAGPQTLAARAEIEGGGTVHLIVDVSGYFAPSVP